MNWVNSSLQLAGTLLESVDQRAALTLSAAGGEAGGADDSGAEDGGEDGEGLLSTIKKGISRAKETAVGGGRTEEAAWEEDAHGIDEVSAVVAGPPRSSGEGVKIPTATRSPPGSTSSAKSFVRQTPPPSGNGRSQAASAHSSPSAASVVGATSSSSALDAECARLKKENAKLKGDLRLKDKTLATQQQSLQVYEEEIEALERECKDKLAEGQQQLAQLRMEKDADEKNFVQALELKESQLQALTTDFNVLKEAERRQAEEMEQLRAEIARAEESKDSLWTNAASASQQSEEVVTSLRVELQEAQQALGNAKREFADAKMKMYERQSQLEKTNAELSTSVATLGRELEKAKETIAANGGSAAQAAQASLGGVATTAAYAQLQEEHRKVQQTLVQTKKMLHDETRRNEIQRQEVLGLAEEVKRLKETLVSAQDDSSKQVISLTKSNAALQEKVAQLEATSAHQTSARDSEARIQTLTNRLIEKQESIDALRSRITTLEVRLTDAQSRSQTAEDKLAQIERSGGIVTMDMEMGTPVGRKGGARARSNRMANAISRVAPVLERSTRVVSALDVLDRWLLFLGRVFLSMPVARLGLLCYVALIHFWVFVVLSFHTSHLNEEVHEGAGVAGAAAAKGHGLGAPGLFPDGMQVPP